MAWWVLVGAMSLLAFGGSAAADERDTRELIYQYEFGVSGLVAYVLVLSLVLLIARGLDWRAAFALRRPESWKKAIVLMIVALVAVFVVGGLLEQIFHAGDEQGLDPVGWQSDKLGPFALSALTVVLAAPIAEEMTFRGLGFSLLSHLGTWAAIAVTGLAFALAHGIVVGIPIFFVIGAALAYLRARTGSLIPAILVHAFFNALQLAVGVSG